VIRPRPASERLSSLARVACAALVLQCFFATAPIARAADPSACAPWPGEFDPLPTVADPDPLRARWAHMRAEQLGQLATRAESRDRAEAARLWQRVQCLEPGSAAASAGLERATRSELVSAPPRATPAAPVAKEEPREKPRPRPQRKPAEPPAPPSVAAPLDRTEQLIRAARFDDALGELERLRPAAARPAERARLEVLAATAQVAFGDDEAARASLGRALDADPKLALDERSTSPKLVRALDDARAVLAAPPYEPAAADVKPLVEPAATP
jgi:hypothetical protein